MHEKDITSTSTVEIDSLIGGDQNELLVLDPKEELVDQTITRRLRTSQTGAGVHVDAYAYLSW
jgi:hypothetical protein